MQTRMLGPAGPRVGAVGFGCMGMNWAYVDQLGDADGFVAAIRGAVDRDMTMLDTADIYGPYRNEELVGRAIRGIRDRVYLATKGGLVADPASRLGSLAVWPNGRPEHLRAACDASLSRLGVDHVDLYYLHRADPAVPLAESWGALAELQAAGKIRDLGISEVSMAHLAEVHAIAPVTAVQSELSLWTRDPLAEVLPWCVANGVGFVPFAPLGRGFLAGRFGTDRPPADDDFRAQLPRFQVEALAHNEGIADGVRAVAERHGVTMAQVALAWTLAQGPHVVPIPGSTSPAHIAQNAAVASLTLTTGDLAILNELPAPIGTRY